MPLAKGWSLHRGERHPLGRRTRARAVMTSAPQGVLPSGPMILPGGGWLVAAAIRPAPPVRTTLVRRAPYRYAGVAAVAVLWSSIGGAALVSGFPLLGPRPLSWLAEEPLPGLLFTAGLASGAILLVAFHQHVRRRYAVDRWFSVAMLGGLAGQLVAAAVPITAGGLAGRLHSWAALLLGCSLPALMWRFAVAQAPGRGRRVAYGLFWAEAAAGAAGLLLSRGSVAAVAEILPAVCFHLWVGVVTWAEPLAPAAPEDQLLRFGALPGRGQLEVVAVGIGEGAHRHAAATRFVGLGDHLRA